MKAEKLKKAVNKHTISLKANIGEKKIKRGYRSMLICVMAYQLA
jgi:hypothetical protein